MIHVHEFADPPHVETPLGHGLAMFVECGRHDYYWTVVLDNGAIVTFTQDRIRFSRNYTFRRGVDDAEMRKIVEPKKK